jgi:membrane protease YdiL (CAAX protease family)
MMTNALEQDKEVGQSAQFRRKEQLLEVSVFLFLILPSLLLSFFAVKQGSVSFALTAVATILRDIGLVCLILFFLWRNRESIRLVGWTFESVWREIALGVVLFGPIYVGAGLLESFLQAAGFSTPATPLPSLVTPRDPGDLVLALLLVVVVALAEETIFRGYLILRFENLTASRTAAVLLSAFIFSLGHGYEGTAGVLTVGTMGLVFAIIYRWRRSLVAPIVLHFLQDFVSIVLLPLLGIN